MGPSGELAALYEADRRDHADVPPVGSDAYAALRERDRERRAGAAAALAALGASASALDLYHAAWLLQHGDDAADARRAHELAKRAAALGHGPARWLAAAAIDRARMYDGLPQRYGTQFVPDGVRYRLWDVDPVTTDADRAEWDVPPLAAQRRRAEELTRTEPQPPLEHAPEWLRGALERWRSE